MSKNLLLILAASVDLWVALLIIQLWQPSQSSEVWLAISDPQTPATPMIREPVQIWLTASGQTGLWPGLDQPMTIPQIRQHLRTVTDRTNEPVEIRLLCDPRLTIGQWAPVALELAAEADPIRIAPLSNE